MHTVGTTITIAAPPGTAWGMIVAFDKYHEWNPFILNGEGAPVVGSRRKPEMRPPGDKAMTKLRHRGYFRGIPALLSKKTLARTEEGFHVLNRALRERAGTAAGVRRVE